MGLDIRLPIGLMFTTFGLLLLGFGVVGDKSIYSRSLGININLIWGAVMLAFGLGMLALGRRGTASAKSAEDSLEGKIMMEEMEHRASDEGQGGEH